MEDRNEITIIKGQDPEKLVVFRAVSLQDEIRFYLNENEYITAFEKDDGNIEVEMREEVVIEKPKNTKSAFAIIKENYKDFLKLIALLILVMSGLMAVGLIICFFINSLLMYLISMFTVFFVFDVMSTVILESRRTSPNLKGKHSAEHMMVNFLEKNKRLPKNMQEIRKMSRFTKGCGSQRLIQRTAEDFVSKVFASIMAVIASNLYLTFFDNPIIDLIVFIGGFCFTSLVVRILINKYKIMDFIIKPLRRVLTNIVQCANTTRNVEDKDIYLAYFAAKEWIKIVYPEFYSEKEDVFMDNHSS